MKGSPLFSPRHSFLCLKQKTMKNQQNQTHNTSTTLNRFLNIQIHLHNLILYILLFGSGLAFGLTANFYLSQFHKTFGFTRSFLPTLTAPQNVSTRIYHGPIGIREFIRSPSDAMHDMEDNELLWRASLVPRARSFPFVRSRKVAFMFLTKGPMALAPLWEKFFKGHEGLYSIYVHSHPSFIGKAVPESSVFHHRRVPSKIVKWGETNMIEAERRLLGNALLDFSNQRFVLLSESCIPLFNFSTIYKYLMKSTKTFVEVYDLEGAVGRGRYNSKMEPVIKLEQWRKGSQWFEMDRKLALEIVSDQRYFSSFRKYCQPPCYSDEHYIPTFVHMKFGRRNGNRTLTWADWSKGGPHPMRYEKGEVTMGLLRKLRDKSDCEYNGYRPASMWFLFARKFSSNTLDRLLKLAPQVMHFGAS